MMVPTARPAQPREWPAPIADGAVTVAAREVNNWLLLEMAVADVGRRAKRQLSMWDLARANASLGGPAKFALNADGLLVLCAEIPVVENTDGTTRLAEARKDFEVAPSLLADARGGRPHRSAVGHGPAVELEPLCAEIGWPVARRTENRLALPLDVDDASFSAIAEARDGGVRLAAEIATFENPGRASREAAGAFLLWAGGAFYMVRGGIAQSGEDVSARLEVSFASPPCATELARALEALSVACRECGQDLDALRDEELAETYLAVRGGPRESCEKHNPNKKGQS